MNETIKIILQKDQVAEIIDPKGRPGSLLVGNEEAITVGHGQRVILTDVSQQPPKEIATLEI